MSRIGVRRKLTLVGAALLLAVVGVLAFAPLASANAIDLGQGQMAGEVTTGSVILQSRLTVAGSPLIGTPGVGRFEISTTPGFAGSFLTDWVTAGSANDFIIKVKVTGLNPGTRYYYRLLYGPNMGSLTTGPTCTFRTLDLPTVERETSFIVTTGWQYFTFHGPPSGPPNRGLGYPALETMLLMNPDFVVATGDNVYYDAWPVPRTTQAEMRENWHKQFIQPRFLDLFSQVPFYWMKDDHDFRYNDADNVDCGYAPSAALGISTFLEQVPVVDPDDPTPLTYRTHRINELVQIWLLEGRDYRSPNMMDPADPNKTLWGDVQKAWLKASLLASDAPFKFLISPTPMIGPDDLMIPPLAQLRTHCQDTYNRDKHTTALGFKTEGDAFFTWLNDNGFLAQNFYILCGDRHWKYHSIHPDGFEEYSCGALVDTNSRIGVAPGDPSGSDPGGLITQPYTDAVATGGFLKVTVKPGAPDTCEFTFYDENGTQLHPAAPAVAAATGTGMVTSTTMSGTIQNLTALAESSLPSGGKPSLEFPHGFFSFDITGLSVGETVTVTIELPSAVPVGTQYWKYHASEGGWIQIPMGDDDGDNVIRITLVDGGLGDDDGVADGTIVDQGGPGQPPAPAAGVPVFPTVFGGIAAAVAAGFIGFALRRRLLR